MSDRPLRLLLLEDSAGDAELIQGMLAAAPVEFEVEAADRLEQAVERLVRGRFDAALVDLGLPDSAGLQTFYQVQAAAPDLPVIVFTGSAGDESGLVAIGAGAQDYLVKGRVDGDTLVRRIRYAIERSRTEEGVTALRRHGAELLNLTMAAQDRSIPGLKWRGMVSRNPRMLENLAIVRRVADTDIPVLVRGESGTGKELVARALHDSSRREAMPFVVINCAAVPETLLEADLFGVRKGTATGVAERKGKFELADGGTMFLDEIGDMSPALQAKLLRVLQDCVVERVGGHTSIKVDVRVVAATNQDLEKSIEAGRFRKDLYYRLNAVEIILPPLRDSGEDIEDLVKYFVDRFNRELDRKVTGAEPGVLERFRAHPWPGNIRQLEYVIKRAVAVADGTLLRLADLPDEFQQVEPKGGEHRAGRVRTVRESIERKVTGEVEKRLVHDCLQRAEWNVAEAARLAGYSRVHLYRLMRKHGISRPKRAPGSR